MMPPFKIGSLARQAGTNAPTIRYYEEIGLLPSSARASGRQRVYGEDDLARLVFVRRCREMGFPLERVRSLVALIQDRRRSCLEARDLAQEHLVAVRAKLDELRALERTIASFVTSCDDTCAGGPAPDCVILEDLSRSRPQAESAPDRDSRCR